MPPEQRGREASMTTELSTDLDRSIRRRFGTLGDDARVRRTAAALEANGISVLRLAASASGSQLGPYVTGAGRLILVVGTQKIVSDLEEGLRRINEYVFPLEDARAQAAYGVHSGVNKVLIINRELLPGRITVVFVDEVLGFYRKQMEESMPESTLGVGIIGVSPVRGWAATAHIPALL